MLCTAFRALLQIRALRRKLSPVSTTGFNPAITSQSSDSEEHSVMKKTCTLSLKAFQYTELQNKLQPCAFCHFRAQLMHSETQVHFTAVYYTRSVNSRVILHHEKEKPISFQQAVWHRCKTKTLTESNAQKIHHLNITKHDCNSNYNS